MKSVYAPHLGRNVRFGRIIPRVPHHGLKFSRVLHTADAPTPPPSTNWAPSSMLALRQMYKNDEYGCCVISARYHRIGLLTGAANPGKPFIATDAEILSDYAEIGGFDPNNPQATDNGCDMTVAANHGVHEGYADGSKDLGWVTVDASDKAQVMLAFWLVENGDLGIALPDAWINPFPAGDGFIWDVAGEPDPNNGHNVEIVDYDVTRGVLISTWGLLGWITWSALAKYGVTNGGGELLVHINADQLQKAINKAPNGIDWNTILQYFNQDLGGSVPIPAPAPTGPSLADAQVWAAAGLAQNWPK